MKKIIIGTRGSGLALFQAELSRRILYDRFPDLKIEIQIIETEGDIDRISPLSSFGGRGAFVRNVELALLSNEIDVAVHSLKDLPSNLQEGLSLGAVPVREDPSDIFISLEGHSFKDLPEGSIVATGSDRRIVQLKKIRPDILFHTIRGNIETRINKLGNKGIKGIVLAYAGVKRLGFENRITQIFNYDELLPAPCQGAIGLECRACDSEILSMLSEVENKEVRLSVDIERTFISVLGMGCHAPVAALARVEGEEVIFAGLVADKNGLVLKETLKASAMDAADAASDLAEKFRKRMEG
jgi:hydroxymethylbilane synthase